MKTRHTVFDTEGVRLCCICPPSGADRLKEHRLETLGLRHIVRHWESAWRIAMTSLIKLFFALARSVANSQFALPMIKFARWPILPTGKKNILDT